ncbi:MAG: hypothetical protein QG608_2845, partial [Actinomycetota bacterium]|nr:hypothetical protein [Actinomycetota bacterium]
MRVGSTWAWQVGRGPGTCGASWQMAVGVVVLPPGCTGFARQQDRVELAWGAYQRGYYLLERVEVAAEAPEWERVWSVASGTTADAVVVYST